MNWFYKLVARKNKAKLAFALMLVVTWGTLPSTACVCADGTVKVFCSRICSGGDCCCSAPTRSCPGCKCHSGICKSATKSAQIAKLLDRHQLSKPCGCHRIAKDQAFVLRTFGEENDTQSAHLCSTFGLGSSNLVFLQSASICSETRGHPPDGLVILFCHLVI